MPKFTDSRIGEIAMKILLWFAAAPLALVAGSSSGDQADTTADDLTNTTTGMPATDAMGTTGDTTGTGTADTIGTANRGTGGMSVTSMQTNPRAHLSSRYAALYLQRRLPRQMRPYPGS
jgi:hypothetical protein